MIDIKLKGMLNQHTLIKDDSSNIANDDNHNVYSQVLVGNTNSDLVKYLLNLNHQGLSDFKSMMAYNESNQAGIINESQKINEVRNFKGVTILPKPKKKISNSFSEILKKRHSTRKFSGLPFNSNDLSNLLYYSFGIAPRKMKFGDITVNTKFYASGGGLYPIKVYLYCNNVEGIDKGLYLYQPVSHSLLSISENRNIDINNFFEGNEIISDSANIHVFYGFRISSVYLKYGELSLLTSFLEVGEMSHNFDLVSTALGFSTCTIAGFKKKYIEDLIEFDHVDEHVLLSSICGME